MSKSKFIKIYLDKKIKVRCFVNPGDCTYVDADGRCTASLENFQRHGCFQKFLKGR